MDRCICDIFHDGKMWKKIKVLEYQAEAGLDILDLILGRHTDFTVFCPDRLFAHIADLSTVDACQKCRTAEQCRLAGAGRSDDRKHLSFLYMDGNVFQHLKPVKLFFDMIHFKKIRTHTHSS